MTVRVMNNEPVSFVIATFEDGVLVSYWGDGDDSGSDCEQDAIWYTDRAKAVDELGNIPRNIDARIYELRPSPEPSVMRETDGGILPEFLRAPKT